MKTAVAGDEDPARKGRKLSVWFSADQLAEIARRNLTPAEVVRRGLLWGDDVAMPPELGPSMSMVQRLAQALANGGRVTYPDSPVELPPGSGSGV